MSPSQDPVIVTKPWGQERWLQAGNRVYPFAFKEITLLSGKQTSLQAHKTKSETVYVISGSGKLLWHPMLFDCDKFVAGGYSQQEIADIVQHLRTLEIREGSLFHTPPCTIHRMIAYEDLVYFEASTTELDDVIRIQDDANRHHGRIDAEHQ